MKFQALNNEIFAASNDMIEFDEIMNSDSFSAPENLFENNELAEIDFSEEGFSSLREIMKHDSVQEAIEHFINEL